MSIVLTEASMAFVGHFITHLFMHPFLGILANLCTQELMSHFGYSMGYFTRKMLHHPGASLSRYQIAFGMPTCS